MNTHYASTKHAIRSLDRLALSTNKGVYLTLEIDPLPNNKILVTNGTASLALNIEQHTRKEMRSKLINFIGKETPEVIKKSTKEIRASIKKTTASKPDDKIRPNYANPTNAVKSLNKIAYTHDPELYNKIDITYFPKIGIRIATSKSVLTFNVADYTKYQLRSIIVRYMEEMR